jgi:hypothetical protein
VDRTVPAFYVFAVQDAWYQYLGLPREVEHVPIPPTTEEADGQDDDLVATVARRGHDVLERVRPAVAGLLETAPAAVRERASPLGERVRDRAEMPTDGPTMPGAPSTRPSRRTALVALAGAAVGATVASPDAVGDALGGVSLGGGGMTVDPAVTAGDAHREVLALVPKGEATHRATSSGRWGNPGIWDAGEVPPPGSRALVEDGITVTVAGEHPDGLKTLRVDGTLRFHRAKDTHLAVETLVTTPGSLLDLGHPGDPISSGTEARLTFADLGPIDEDWDPGRRTTGLLTMGAVTVHGTARTTWTALANHPQSGDRTLELPAEPENWSLGDRVVVPGNHPVENQDESAVVTGVSGTTIELDRSLEHDHVPPADDLDAYVVTLSRNVRFESENTEIPRRGHVMFMDDEVDVRYAGFYELGRTDKSYPFTNPIHGTPPKDVPPNPRARYALHFHKTGVDTEDPGHIEGVAVDGSPGWGVVNHHSHVEVSDSVTHDVFGSGFVAEAGNERGAFRRNFALRSEGSGQVPDARRFHGGDNPGDVDDFGHGGHGFWFQGPTVAVEDNVAAGHRHYGFVFWNRPLVDRELLPGEEIRNRRGTVPNFPMEYADVPDHLAESDKAADGRISSALIPLQRFRNNTAFASGGGMEISRHQFGHDHTRYGDYGVIEEFTAHDIGPLVRGENRVLEPHRGNKQGGNNGLTIRYSHNLRVRGARILSGRDAEMEAATGGVGINRNTPYPFNVVVEDSEVRGFRDGIHAMTRGNYLVRDTQLSNRTNLVVDQHDGGPDRTVAMEGVTSDRGPAVTVALDDLDDTDPEQLFTADGGGLSFEGRMVYLDAQRPDAVPVPTKKGLQKLGHRDQLKQLTDGDPEGVVGRTNRQLQREYGIAVHGTIAPGDAERDPRVEGGLLGPTGDGGGGPPRERWLEAQAADFEHPFRLETDVAASRGKYLVARAVSKHDAAPSTGHATFDLRLAPGTYRVHGRVLAEGGSDDSFWVRMDDGPWHKWNGIRARHGWRWHQVWDSDDDSDGPVTFDLDGGEHRLTVAYREDGTKLDKLLVTALDTAPVWMGEPLAGRRG